MQKGDRPTLLSMVREHNRLNGFWLVLTEFLGVALAALFISWAGLLHHRIVLAIVGIGISVNALAVIAITAGQLRDHDPSEGLLKMRSSRFRAKVRHEHPSLATHTAIVMLSVLVPFLLLAVLAFQDAKGLKATALRDKNKQK